VALVAGLGLGLGAGPRVGLVGGLREVVLALLGGVQVLRLVLEAAEAGLLAATVALGRSLLLLLLELGELLAGLRERLRHLVLRLAGVFPGLELVLLGLELVDLVPGVLQVLEVVLVLAVARELLL